MAPEPCNFNGDSAYANGLPTFPGGLEVVMVRTAFFFWGVGDGKTLVA